MSLERRWIGRLEVSRTKLSMVSRVLVIEKDDLESRSGGMH